MRIQIRILNADQVKANVGEKFEELNKNLEFALSNSANKLLAASSRKAPSDTGRLRSSLAVRKHITGLSVSVGTNVKYAPFVHEGTRPHFPPISAIAPWARRHGLNPFLVARGISRRGTQAQPFLEDSFNQMRRSIKKDIQNAVRKTFR